MIVETKAGRAYFNLQAVKTANRIVVDFLNNIVLAPQGTARSYPYNFNKVCIVGILCAICIRVIVANDMVSLPPLADTR